MKDHAKCTLLVTLALAAIGTDACSKEESAARPGAAEPAVASEPAPRPAPSPVQTAEARVAEIAAKGHKLDVETGKGRIEIPAGGAAGDLHVKHHWRMPPDAQAVAAIVRWNDTSWRDLSVSIGTGGCPHTGQKLAETVSSSGLAVVEYAPVAVDPTGDATWFLHVNPDAAAPEKQGASLDYTFEIYVF